MASEIKKDSQRTPRYDPYLDKRRLELTNDLLAEEAQLAKSALCTALDKLGFDWSPASRDYSVMRDVLAVSSRLELERMLALSEERRLTALHTIAQLRHVAAEAENDRDDVLVALTGRFAAWSYRCVYMGSDAVVVETEMGSVCWFVGEEAAGRFAHLEQRQAPPKVLAPHERTAALVTLGLLGAAPAGEPPS